MTQDALPGLSPLPVPARATGRVAAALAAVVADDTTAGAHARRYPVGLALAEVVARALDDADARGSAAIVAQLAKTAQLVFAPLGLSPDPLSHPGDPVGDKPTGDTGGLAGFGSPTLVHSA